MATERSTADAVGRWAGRLMPPGPALTRAEAVEVVDELRAAAQRALPVAERAARMSGPLDRAGRGTPAPVLVVDRPGWARAAAQWPCWRRQSASD
ncbi:MAG TPA: hypothetical protein PKB06_03715, partial [Actinotalea sp.]|nr:hypothetical protein [Actinotalea sp.]